MMNIAQYIDHTLLKADATIKEIQTLCLEAKENNFKAVCINQNYIKLAKKELENSEIKICTVVGFPLGATSTQVKLLETKLSIENGANEVDMVLNISELKNQNFEYVQNDIKALADICTNNNVILKVIFETCLLTNKEIAKASKLAMDAGAHFIKTSTGFSKSGATIEAVEVMRNIVKNKLEIKASGGIKDKETAEKMIKAGATRIGTSSGVKIVSNQSDQSSDY